MIAALLMAGGVASAVGPEASGTAGAVPAPDFSLTVSPTRLTVGPDQLDHIQTFQVTNGGRLPVDIVVNTANFTIGGDGAMAFAKEAPYSAAGWIEVSPATFHLPAGRRQQVSVRIDPPEKPDNGEHQVALLFVAPPNPNAAGNIKVNRTIGTPIYITVPGPVDTSVRIGGLRSAGFAMGGPVEFGVTVDNLGTVRRDFFGREALKVEVNGREIPFPDFTVLRGGSRDVTVRWADPPLMCICHAKVSIAGTSGTITRSATVVIFPLHLLALLGGAAVVLYGLTWWARRRYRAQVLAAAQRLHGSDDRDGDHDGNRDGRDDDRDSRV